QRSASCLVRLPGFLGLVSFVWQRFVHCWGGKLFLGLFSCWVLAAAVHSLRIDPALLVPRVPPWRPAVAPRRSQFLRWLSWAFSCGVLVVAGLEHRSHGSAVGWLGVLAASGVFLLGLVSVLFVFRANSYTAGTVRVEAGKQVVDAGPYAWVRHPMYSASML